MDEFCSAECGRESVAQYRLKHKDSGMGQLLSVCQRHKEQLLAGVMVDLGAIRVTLWEERVPRLRVDDGRLIRKEPNG